MNVLLFVGEGITEINIKIYMMRICLHMNRSRYTTMLLRLRREKLLWPPSTRLVFCDGLYYTKDHLSPSRAMKKTNGDGVAKISRCKS